MYAWSYLYVNSLVSPQICSSLFFFFLVFTPSQLWCIFMRAVGVLHQLFVPAYFQINSVCKSIHACNYCRLRDRSMDPTQPQPMLFWCRQRLTSDFCISSQPRQTFKACARLRARARECLRLWVCLRQKNRNCKWGNFTSICLILNQLI